MTQRHYFAYLIFYFSLFMESVVIIYVRVCALGSSRTGLQSRLSEIRMTRQSRFLALEPESSKTAINGIGLGFLLFTILEEVLT